MSVITVTKENFNETVMKSDKKVLLDFWAAWCGPCQMLSPVLEELAAEHPEVVVGKVNADEEMELIQQFKVVSIPMLVLMENGEIVKKSIGYKSKEELETELF